VELAINLGPRYEIDTPCFDPEYRMSHGLDLSVRKDTIASNPPQTLWLFSSIFSSLGVQM